MDKKSLIMVVAVAAVIFLLITLTNKCSKDKDLQTVPDNEQPVDLASAPAGRIDSITAADLTYAADYIRQAGKLNAATGAYDLHLNNVDLALKDSIVSGSIHLNDSTSISYEDVAASRFPEGWTLKEKSDAAHALREALRTAGSFLGFARYLSPDTVETAPVTLKNDALALEFSPKGGYISKATLLKYDTYFPEKNDPKKVDTANVVVFAPKDNAMYEFTLRTVAQREISTGELFFTPRQVNDSVVEMTLDLGGGAVWGYRYTLPSGDNYLVGMEIIQKNISSVIPPSAVTAPFHWHQSMPRQERGRTFEERNSSIYYKYVGDSPDDIGGNKSGAESLNQSVRWVAFKNQFFSTVVIPRKPFDGGRVSQGIYKDVPDYLKDMDARMTVQYDVDSDIAAGFDIFIGPNLYNVLSDVDDQVKADDGLSLTRLIPLGWSWLRWINTLIIIPLFSFLSGFISNYGIIILVLTIIIKIILFPLTYKSYQSQAKMRVLAPEIKEINDKYPGQENAMKRQQETMALYSRAGASPFSGCLPLLLQMPILIAMFSFFPSCIELRGESFLWAQDLAAPDSIIPLPFRIPVLGDHLSLFCLLMTITNVIYTYLNMKSQPSSSTMPGMKWMMYLMPLMFLFFFNDYAAALSYYYFLSLLITIIQTWAFRFFLDEKKMRQKMMENASNPKKRKKGGWMERLQEKQRQMLREQQEMQKNNRRR